MIVLDTCAVLWDALEPARLSKKAKTAIEQADAAGEILISDISLWEIAMLISRKRVHVQETPAKFLHLILQARPYRVVALSPEIAELAVMFDERVNGDPADRIILSTTISSKAALISADRNLREAGVVEVVW